MLYEVLPEQSTWYLWYKTVEICRVTWTAKGKPILAFAPLSTTYTLSSLLLLLVCLWRTAASFFLIFSSFDIFPTLPIIAIFQTPSSARKFLPSQFTDSISAIMLHSSRRRKPGQYLGNFSTTYYTEDVCSVAFCARKVDNYLSFFIRPWTTWNCHQKK